MRVLTSAIRCLFLMTLLLGALGPRSAGAQPRQVGDGKGSPFGVASNLGNRVRSDEQPEMIALMREARVQWAREEISWDRVQFARGGPYRWDGDQAGMYNYDRAIALQRGAGIQVLGLLGYNPAWFKGKNPVLNEWIDDWGDYVYNVVARYGRDRDQIRYWEVWNEPNLRPFGYEHGLYTVDDFVRVLKVAHAAIRAADPDAVIVLGGLADIWSPIPTAEYYDSLDYLRMIHEAGGWDFFDIVSLHPYRPSAPEFVLNRRGDEMSFQQELDILQTMLNAFGQKPIWLTEFGWSSYTGTFGVTEAEQAAYLQRMYILALAHPSVEKIFWYDFRDDASSTSPYDRPVYDRADDQLHYGMIRRTYPLDASQANLRKPAYLAFRALADAVQGMNLDRIVADGNRVGMPGVYWYHFSNGESQVDIIWRLYGDPIDIEVPCDCREARVRQWDGRLIKVTLTDNRRVVGRLDELGSPIMIERGPDRLQEGQLFSQTGHYLRGGFATKWIEGGGLAQFGYPITGELVEPDARTGEARTVQYFERNRFDFFPEFRSTPFVIQLGRLGEIALSETGVAWEKLPRRSAGDEGCLFFSETGHQICSPFRERWERDGGLAQHGLPLTDAYVDDGTLVQYFERSRFEEHPDNPPDFRVQLGLLSRELYSSWGRWR